MSVLAAFRLSPRIFSFRILFFFLIIFFPGEASSKQNSTQIGLLLPAEHLLTSTCAYCVTARLNLVGLSPTAASRHSSDIDQKMQSQSAKESIGAAVFSAGDRSTAAALAGASDMKATAGKVAFSAGLFSSSVFVCSRYGGPFAGCGEFFVLILNPWPFSLPFFVGGC